jgi:quinol-cytochrome oxidoreductase complex cytochrome b subunit
LFVLVALAADPIVLRAISPMPLPGWVWLMSVLIYAVVVVFAIKSIDARAVDAVLNPTTSRLAAIYLYMYCIVIMCIAIFIPGTSGSLEFACRPVTASCASKSDGYDFALRLLGLLSAMDFVDGRRWRRRTRGIA